MEVTFTFIRFFFFFIYLCLPLLGFLLVLIVALGQVVIHFEKWDRFDGLYWSFITATTVGYGDIRPQKKISKAIAVVIALAGLILTGMIVAISIHAGTQALEKHVDMQEIEELKKKIGPEIAE